MVWHQNAIRTYRLLLRAYPAEFRHEYGEEMESVFASRLAVEPVVRIWLEVLTDIFLTASVEHFHVFASDLRQSIRSLIKSPGFLVVSLLAMMLGVGATTTVFSLLNAVLIRSLPYGNAEQLVYLWTPLFKTADVEKEIAPPYSDVVSWQRESRTLSSITCVQRYRAELKDRAPLHVGAARVLGNFFETLDVYPEIGRTLRRVDEAPGNQFVAVISDMLWRSHFGGSPEILGKTIYLDDKYYRVVGVMPKQFSYPQGNDFPGQYQFASLPHTDIWVPAAFTKKELADPDFGLDAAIGRLRTGATLSSAQFEVSALERRLVTLHSEGMRDSQALLIPFIETTIGPVRPLFHLLTGSVLLVLFMSCGNLAGLLLARAIDRAPELGLRTALGAKRSRLVRSMMTEALTLSLLGGVVAILFSFVALKLLANLNPGDIPRYEEAVVDIRVLAFGLLASIGSGFAGAILPALSLSGSGVNELIHQRSRAITTRSLRFRSSLIVAEVALSTVLLIASGLFIRSYLAVIGEDKGFAQSALTMSTELEGHVPNADALRRELMDRIKTAPSVEVAGSIDDLPLSSFEDKGFLTVEGYVNPIRQTANVRSTAGEYFQAMRIPLLAGRYLDDRDIPKKPNPPRNCVASNSFAKRYFSGRNPIGRRIQVNELGWSTIVGIVGDVRHSSLERAPEPTIYVQDGNADSVVVQTRAPRETVIASIKKAAKSVDNRFTVTDIHTMDQYVQKASAHRRFQTAVLTSFATLSILLGLIGLYGLLSYAVRQRKAEIGIRMALGASRGAVVAMIGSYGLRLASAGLFIGGFFALGLTKVMARFLYGVRPIDPLTFIAVSVLTITVATVASVTPALKAAFIDPANTLREQ
jgi:predicted permease